MDCYIVLLLLFPATFKFWEGLDIGFVKGARQESWLISFSFSIILLLLLLLYFFNRSNLKDPYSSMVAGQATPSGVIVDDNEDDDQHLTVKKHCKLVVAIPDRLD